MGAGVSKENNVMILQRGANGDVLYKYKPHPTKYVGVQFRSRLEARWAAFFDLANWQWSYEPIDLEGWTPDFQASFPCSHSECVWCEHMQADLRDSGLNGEDHARDCVRRGEHWDSIKADCEHRRKYLSLSKENKCRCAYRHELYIEVKPFHTLAELEAYPAYDSVMMGWIPPHPALFGLNPDCTSWVMPHGAGGGEFRVSEWVRDAAKLWKEAGNSVQWTP
jgi:hypothetical protein